MLPTGQTGFLNEPFFSKSVVRVLTHYHGSNESNDSLGVLVVADFVLKVVSQDGFLP